MGLEVAAGVSVSLGADDVKGIGSSVAESLLGSTPHPLYLSLSGSSGSPTAAPGGTVFMGSPPIGRIWEVVALTVTGADAFTTVATGTVALCIGNSANPVLNHIRVPQLTLPQYKTCSSAGMWVHNSEELYYLISPNMPAGQVYYLQAQVEEWREGDISMSSPGFSPAR